MLGLRPEETVIRPAMIVNVNATGTVDLCVFTNGYADDRYLKNDECSSRDSRGKARSVVHRMNVVEAGDPAARPLGCWFWPPRTGS
ncbi:MAG TPA: hypothetical protein VE261_00370 [Gaiellaceae bacterium]|nr:hypothetical protein [Gaiellaceae bacterium]